MLKTYQCLARAVQAYQHCIERGTEAFAERWEEDIEQIMADAPSGSGFDAGTTLDLEASNGNKLVFHTSFHHMDEHGFYDEWTEHTLTVRGHLAHGFSLHISGRNKNGIKDYIEEVFCQWLMEDR